MQVSLSNRFELRGRIYYDQNEQRVAIKEEIQLGEERDFYEDYAFFKQVCCYVHCHDQFSTYSPLLSILSNQLASQVPVQCEDEAVYQNFSE